MGRSGNLEGVRRRFALRRLDGANVDAVAQPGETDGLIWLRRTDAIGFLHALAVCRSPIPAMADQVQNEESCRGDNPAGRCGKMLET